MRKRVFITIGLLSLYLVLYFTPIIGINYSAIGPLPKMIKLMASDTVLKRLSICWLGILPYVSAHILILLLSGIAVIRLEKFKKPYSPIWFLTIFLSILSGWLSAGFIQEKLVYNNINLVLMPGRLFLLTTAIILTLGLLVTIWIGNTITRKGIGNGISLIIFINIMIYYLVNLKQFLSFSFLSLMFLAAVVTVLMLRKEEKIKIRYIEDKRDYFFRIPVSYIGIIPGFFANAIILFPLVIFKGISSTIPLPKLNTGTPGYWILYGALIIFFSYFWTYFIFNPLILAKVINSMKASIPGRESEKQVTSYLRYILLKISLTWGLFLAGLTLLPKILKESYHIQAGFSGWDLFLIVGICIGCYGYLENCLRKPKTKEIVLSPDPKIILGCRNFLEHRGIKTYIQDREIYGKLLGLFFGPLAEKRLLVDEQNYSKSKEIIFKSILPPPPSETMK